jgi:hypothetical protein
MLDENARKAIFGFVGGCFSFVASAAKKGYIFKVFLFTCEQRGGLW